MPADGSAPVYVGRLGLTDADGRRLLVDWRSPAAEPFFAATLAHPAGLASRRRYRWTGGRVTDYWDEAFDPEALADDAALDDESSFLASLGASRSERMRDVLGTIAADQDAVIRAGARGALVVDGGPGTGKTVVALHRTAYLLHSEPRLGHRRGGVLFVGPHQPYLDYVSDVLPSLGEDDVRVCTLRDLVPEGATVRPETDPQVARLKASLDLVRAIEPAVRFSERPPTAATSVETEWADVLVEPVDWAEAFASPEPGMPHNEARAQVRETLVEIVVDKVRAVADVPDDEVRRALQRHRGLHRAIDRAWPTITATDLVADLWSVPAYLRLCAPALTPDEVQRLQRADASAWTDADLPLLDAARRRLGDPQAELLQRRRAAVREAEREVRSAVVDHLVESDDSEMAVMSMLRGADLTAALDDDAGLPTAARDPLDGPFAHVVVDEAQELTDAQSQSVLARCPSRSLTVVGDRAQARHGFAETWQERLARVGVTDARVATLTVNYRTPVEVMAEAEPAIRAALPDANVPTSIRASGEPVEHGPVAALDQVVASWLASAEGTACVVASDGRAPADRWTDEPRVRVLTPELAKGLEFDLVVVVDPASFGDGVAGAVDRYVAMTRATRRLVVLT